MATDYYIRDKWDNEYFFCCRDCAQNWIDNEGMPDECYHIQKHHFPNEMCNNADCEAADE